MAIEAHLLLGPNLSAAWTAAQKKKENDYWDDSYLECRIFTII